MDAGIGIALAATLYLTSQLLRVVRIAVLSLSDRRSMRRLVSWHLLTLWFGALLPFKLGELLRCGGFVALAQPRWSGAAIWAIERAADAITLLFLIGLLAILTPLGFEARPLVGGLLLFSFLVVGGGWTIRETLPFLHDDMLLRSRTRRGLLALRGVIALQNISNQVTAMISGRVGLVLLLSVGIWFCELTSLIFLVSEADLFRDIGIRFRETVLGGGSGEATRSWVRVALSLVGASAVAVLFFSARGARGR